MSPGCLGAQRRNARVRSLEVGTSALANGVNQPKYPAASSGDFATPGRFNGGRFMRAIFLNGTPPRRGGDKALGRLALERKPVDAGGVEAVHGRPAIEPIADIAGHALLQTRPAHRR